MPTPEHDPPVVGWLDEEPEPATTVVVSGKTYAAPAGEWTAATIAATADQPITGGPYTITPDVAAPEHAPEPLGRHIESAWPASPLEAPCPQCGERQLYGVTPTEREVAGCLACGWRPGGCRVTGDDDGTTLPLQRSCPFCGYALAAHERAVVDGPPGARWCVHVDGRIEAVLLVRPGAKDVTPPSRSPSVQIENDIDAETLRRAIETGSPPRREAVTLWGGQHSAWPDAPATVEECARCGTVGPVDVACAGCEARCRAEQEMSRLRGEYPRGLEDDGARPTPPPLCTLTAWCAEQPGHGGPCTLRPVDAYPPPDFGARMATRRKG